MESAKQEIRIKRKNAYLFRVSVKLIADALILLAILTFFTNEAFFMSGGLPFVLLSILITLPLLFAGMESSTKFNMIFAGIGITLFLTGQFFLRIPWWLSVLILFLLHWRVSAHLEEERDSRFEISGGYMLTLMIVSLVSYAFQNIYEKQPAEIIIFIFISGMLLFTGGTYIVRYAESAEHSKKSTRVKSAKLPLLFLVILASLSTLTAIFNETVSSLLNNVFGGLFWLLSFLIDPIWNLINWILELLPKGVSEGLESLRRPEGDMPYEVTQEDLENGGELSFAWWNEALIGILLLVIVLYMWKKYRNKGWSEEEDSKRYAGYSSYKETVLPSTEKQKAKINYSSANSEIRKAILSLEKQAEGKGMSRLNGETLQEWFTRLGFLEEQEFYHIYESVRYGNKEVDADKAAWFEEVAYRVTAKIIHQEYEEDEKRA
ncbi:hypothetical protein ACOJQI_06780 [Bacillus salacetis]|uniref:hypothetical protein n=1 Tax=Bacillus salacetis TaxID=2315464 RepID=UPI003BA0AEFE